MATRPCSSSGTRAVPLSRGRMAEEAARMVLRLRDGLELTHTRLDLATSLVVRDSTAAPAR
jgi:DNA-binding LacI/PurR family transcriptional regulator